MKEPNFPLANNGLESAPRLRLLLPLDGSSMAESSLKIVELLSSKFILDLMLFHVIETDAPSTIHGEKHLTKVSDAQQYLESIASSLQTGATGGRVGSISVHVHQSAVDDVAESIVDHADEHNSDWIVLCTHGIGGAREVIFGSLAQQALKRGTRPVLLIPPAMAKPGMCPLLRRIMLPLDADHPQEKTLELAAEIAREFAAELHLVSVIPTPQNARGEAAFTQRFLPNTMKVVLDLAERDVADQMQRNILSPTLHGIQTRTKVIRGDVLKQLVSYAEQAEIDMFIVTSHGRHGISAIFEGSLVPRLINQTSKPLLLVRVADASDI